MEPEPKRIKTEKPKGVAETDVGIISFISPDLGGFNGVLKQRYSDFQVNEIDENGKVVHLTDFGLKPEEKKHQDPEKPKERQEIPDISEYKEELVQLLGEELVDKIQELFHTGSKLESERAFTDKDERTRIHRLCAKAWNNRLDTQTTGENHLFVRLATRGTRSKGASNGESSKKAPFLKFTVYKENKETMEVASLMSKFLRIKPKDIAFAGTKDRRGVTTQAFSIRHIDAKRVSAVQNALKNVYLGGFESTKEPVRLGDLLGNQFFIAIRNVDGQESDISKAFESLRDHGFINYFGLQRFGTFNISTHTIGRHILAEKYDDAVSCILEPQDLASEESQEARVAWQKGDLQKALELMPRRCNAEVAILSALQESPSSINAILRIPRNLKLMYVHAYQSYIWNLAASERIKRGLSIQEGDLVLSEETSQFQRARPVTLEEIEQGTKTIYDVVLPTPGFDINYPSNLKDFYQETMAKDSIDYLKMRRNVREFSLSGAYRLLLAKPQNVQWWFTSYDESEDQLLRTDYDLITSDPGNVAQLGNSNARVVIKDGGKKRAVILKMDLGTSQYATMALREAMKSDTSRYGQLYFEA